MIRNSMCIGEKEKRRGLLLELGSRAQLRAARLPFPAPRARQHAEPAEWLAPAHNIQELISLRASVNRMNLNRR